MKTSSTLALSLCALLATPVLAQEVDPGDVSVLSQQGQRLKIAVPFGAEPGARIPVMRFHVAAVEASPGYRAPTLRGFTVSKPERRNVIFLQSAEPVDAPQLRLVLAVAGEQAQEYEYDIAVPPARATRVAGPAPSEATQPAPQRKPRARKPGNGLNRP